MNMRFRLALCVSAMSMLVLPAAASAVPGDPAISDPLPGAFRLDDGNLEPGCFVPGRFAPVDISRHIDLTYLSKGEFVREMHISVDDDAPFNVDQVLVPSVIDGYNVVNEFSNTNRPADIGPDQTAVDLFAPDSDGSGEPDSIDVGDVIICVSDHGAAQNEPYQQEAGGLVSAKNRPIIAPKVTALGQSAISNLKTYKIGFGYAVEKWYTAPTYDGALPYSIPAFTRIDVREDPGTYDARRVNDVDQSGEDYDNGKADYGQTTLFKREGDLTAWTSSNNNNPDTLAHLVTFNAQGDLPMSWTLRPSLASPSSLRKVTFTDDDFRAWEKGWQDYYCGKGPHPAMRLAPGTNSPDPRDCAVVVNLPESAPAEVTNVVSAPVVQAPAAQVINTAVVKPGCVSKRMLRFKFGKKVVKASVSFNGRTLKARKSGGRMRVKLSLKGFHAESEQYANVVVKTKKRGHHTVKRVRLFKLCG